MKRTYLLTQKVYKPHSFLDQNKSACFNHFHNCIIEHKLSDFITKNTFKIDKNVKDNERQETSYDVIKPKQQVNGQGMSLQFQ